MSYQPDLVVEALGTRKPILIVEAKLGEPGLKESEAELARYMVAVRCPVGLMVSLQKLLVYEDTHTTLAEDSVRLVAETAVPDALSRQWEHRANRGGPPELRAMAFAQALREWLEEIARDPTTLPLDAEFRAVVTRYVLPALGQGEVRPGGFSWPRNDLQ